MKELKVTGIAQENDFESESQVQYLLVINKGELRIPVTQEAAQQVLQLIYSNGHSKTAGQESVAPSDENGEIFGEEEVQDEGYEVADEDGVDQV